jgi:hypothetical protein
LLFPHNSHNIIPIYCNVNDEALLGNDPVTQQWKGSDRCYAMAQYTGVNNGVEDVFCGRCGSYITQPTNYFTRYQGNTTQYYDTESKKIQLSVFMLNLYCSTLC